MKNLTYAQLARQIQALSAQAAELRARETSEAASQARALIQAYGLGAAEIGLETPKKPAKRGKYRALYRDPATGAGWAGRGRIPRWLAPHLANGKSKEDFRIPG